MADNIRQRGRVTAKNGLQVSPSIGVHEPAQPHQKGYLSRYGDTLAAPDSWDLQGLRQHWQIVHAEAEQLPSTLMWPPTDLATLCFGTR